MERDTHRKREGVAAGEDSREGGVSMVHSGKRATESGREREKEAGGGGQTSVLSHPSAAHTTPATPSAIAQQYTRPQDRNTTLLSVTHTAPTSSDTSPASTAPSTAPASLERECERARAREWARRATHCGVQQQESHQPASHERVHIHELERRSQRAPQNTYCSVDTQEGHERASHQHASHERESIHELEHRSQRAQHTTSRSIHELLRPSLTLALSESHPAPTPEPGPRNWARSPSPSQVFFYPLF